jgi:hypothetical protein
VKKNALHNEHTRITALSAGAVHAMKNPADVAENHDRREATDIRSLVQAVGWPAFMKNAVFMKTAVVCEIQQRLQQNLTICYEC